MIDEKGELKLLRTVKLIASVKVMEIAGWSREHHGHSAIWGMAVIWVVLQKQVTLWVNGIEA